LVVEAIVLVVVGALEEAGTRVADVTAEAVEGGQMVVGMLVADMAVEAATGGVLKMLKV
jgi:hypothetical protein